MRQLNASSKLSTGGPSPSLPRCSEGSFNPLSIDVIAGPGEYVAPDGSGVLPCPVGMSCPGGCGGHEGMDGSYVLYKWALNGPQMGLKWALNGTNQPQHSCNSGGYIYIYISLYKPVITCYNCQWLLL